jgi:Xaa-Pro aminopeptidase
MPPYATRLAALRAQLLQQQLDGFVVPMADAYQSEYVPASDRRIEFLTGFTGSAGLVIVMADKAAFFTDSRYTLQASQQVPEALLAIYDSAMKAPTDWIKENAGSGQTLGYDPWLHPASQIDRWHKILAKRQITLRPVETNPVDAIWPERPAAPLAAVQPHDIAYAGTPSTTKRRDIADQLRQNNLDAAILTDAASIAWLLNIRGGDVAHAPLALSYAILRSDGRVAWFIDHRKLTPEVLTHLGPDVMRCDPSSFGDALRELGTGQRRVRLDPHETPAAIVTQLKQAGAILDEGDDPCSLPKACKNPVEQDGMRSAHIRDGAALAEFLCWFDDALAAGQPLTELAVEQQLAECRACHNLYRGPSFDTIAGSGPNGAIVHYRATAASNRSIDRDSFLLLDSGAQYLDGTTDVTRTIATGTISDEMRDRFTRVLKGHIALSRVVFPAGTTGAELDGLARQYLWAAGLDYGHGTGHGVGSYLSVHEGPQGISRRSGVALQPGMVLSNEPGYYKPGHYGIRCENLMLVTEQPEIPGGERRMLGFTPLTLAPFDRRALNLDLLTADDRDWLNAYHRRVFDTLQNLVHGRTAEWLKAATQPL